MLVIHDIRLRNRPDSMNNLQDCSYQMSALETMRAKFPLLFKQKFCRGPFIFTLTDLHRSNIFVDHNWHISCLIDLKLACSRPFEMVEPPYWLTNKSVDEIYADENDMLQTEFMTILKAEQTN
ncbi:hypothetical protein PAAG_12453 [Paracoccidioides lutzii Pb01]|uniref:Aminoglycoside phosphotransferase domain-containing protein n=1 Tax=Paracoccidioides lutzii (strain ATCC MYA-826 / Pb01) TaxID=502779 RepID=A0A0A2V3Y0_PARBA|nr:hypothetical protein PAAG_12453 [Paracoccidioides lutzii Pb01]KGQ00865.1 hypothetical protein PAAG_12453 [Paracoccidioides lutzii Pb01]